MTEDVRPYVIRTYDRWIILVIVLVVGYILFRPIFAFTAYYRGLSFERMLSIPPAMHYYQRSIDIDPNIPDGWIGLGTLYMMDGRVDKSDHDLAVSTFTRGAAANPKNGLLPFLLCRTYYEQGHDFKDALSACLESVGRDPSNKFAWDYAAWSAIQTGDPKDAIRYWTQALAIDPRYYNARLAITRFRPLAKGI
ncbi:MAG TPA: tetratricopeptide repeat protein [Candidatus Eremiobacteraceae bacterium]|nr:tetratricopeptide repeat protein [Candidatus Eremiobacteraceae bacterium]